MIITEYNEEWDNAAKRKYYIEKGFKIGFEIGFEIGRVKEKLSLLKNLLAVKTPIEFIVKATGWSEEKILSFAENDSADCCRVSNRNFNRGNENFMTVDEMRRELQRRLKKSRFAHSIGVANTAVTLAKKFGVDETKAYVAGLLHDCAREFENDELPAQAVRYGIEIGEVEQALPLLLHAYIGAKMIKKIYGVDDAEISQAIYRHTVAAPNMTALDKIIYFADMIEPNRNYPSVNELRALVETKTLDEILLTALSESIIFVVQKNSLVHPSTVAARNFLLLNKSNA